MTTWLRPWSHRRSSGLSSVALPLAAVASCAIMVAGCTATAVCSADREIGDQTKEEE